LLVVDYSSVFFNFIEAEFTQYRNPLGSGPSGNTCPRWLSHVLHRTSTLIIPNESSFIYWMAFSSIGCVKLGHPELESN